MLQTQGHNFSYATKNHYFDITFIYVNGFKGELEVWKKLELHIISKISTCKISLILNYFGDHT
jgi:hypothetical protein